MVARDKNPEIETLFPTVFIVFGATGDLFRHKLLSAIFNLDEKGLLPKHWRILACGRRAFTAETFRDELLPVLLKKGFSARASREFLGHIFYVQGLFDAPEMYAALAATLERFDKEFGACANKLFYLAVPPVLYETILQKISSSGLSIPCGGASGWTRVLVEKPFGRDLASAEKLDTLLGTLFKEEQIFRIDHYLAKETMQNILAFRFGNAVFEPLWNAEHIESVSLRLWEKGGIGTRGGFYRDTGALRDVGQNHLLQMIALIAMDQPASQNAEDIRARRAQVLRSLTPYSSVHAADTIRAYYEGFPDDAGVDKSSDIETYFRLPVYLSVPRWQGVPFFIESGKEMKESRADIMVTFKPVSRGAFGADRNQLTFRVQPDEGISLLFWAKKPGLSHDLEPKELEFSYAATAAGALRVDAYEKVLYDCIRGDQTLFASTAEVIAAWKFITPILEAWKNVPLVPYKKGSTGPS